MTGYLRRHVLRLAGAALLLCATVAVLSAQSHPVRQDKPASAKTTPPADAAASEPRKLDPRLFGNWGVDQSGGCEFRKDGTLLLGGKDVYQYDAADSIWHYWGPPYNVKLTAVYHVAADGKSVMINFKQGHTLIKYIRVK